DALIVLIMSRGTRSSSRLPTFDWFSFRGARLADAAIGSAVGREASSVLVEFGADLDDRPQDPLARRSARLVILDGVGTVEVEDQDVGLAGLNLECPVEFEARGVSARSLEVGTGTVGEDHVLRPVRVEYEANLVDDSGGNLHGAELARHRRELEQVHRERPLEYLDPTASFLLCSHLVDCDDDPLQRV